MTMSASLNEVYNEQKAMISSISRPQQHGLMDEQARCQTKLSLPAEGWHHVTISTDPCLLYCGALQCTATVRTLCFTLLLNTVTHSASPCTTVHDLRCRAARGNRGCALGHLQGRAAIACG